MQDPNFTFSNAGEKREHTAAPYVMRSVGVVIQLGEAAFGSSYNRGRGSKSRWVKVNWPRWAQRSVGGGNKSGWEGSDGVWGNDNRELGIEFEEVGKYVNEDCCDWNILREFDLKIILLRVPPRHCQVFCAFWNPKVTMTWGPSQWTFSKFNCIGPTL